MKKNKHPNISGIQDVNKYIYNNNKLFEIKLIFNNTSNVYSSLMSINVHK